MKRRRIVDLSARAALAILAAALLRPSPSVAQSVSLAPSTMPRIGSVSERYQSYNVEMVEVTGGRFWKPYSPEPDRILQQPASAAGASGADTPAGMNADLYQYRPPIDLDNARLRKLAAALGPAYVRVSGTWANTTYFSATDPPPAAPPAGFKGVLSRAQWKGVVDFARAVNAQIVTSFATGAGTRDAAGVWTAEQATRLVDYTSAIGGRIAAAEFMNEPNLAVMGGAPAGYDAAAYGRDFKRFHAFARAAAPDMLILGPGSVGETADEPGPADGSSLTTRNLLTASRPAAVDAVSYHHYGALSRRCAAMGAQTTADGRALGGVAAGAPTRRWPTTARCATRSRPASRCGSRKPRMPHAAAIRRRARSSTPSAISTSLAASPGRESRSSPTTRWSRATTASSTTSR